MATTILTDMEDFYGNLSGGVLKGAILGTGAITPTVSPAPINSEGYIAVFSSSNPTNHEIMKFTANASGTLTITAGNRGLGDSTATTHDDGSTVIIGMNTALLEEIDAALAARITASSSDTLTNKSIDGDDNTITDLDTTAIKSTSLATTISSPGVDTKIATEKAVRDAIIASIAGVASVDALTGAVTTSAGEGITKTIVSNDIEFAVDNNEQYLFNQIFA